MAPGPSAPRRRGFEAVRANNCGERRKWRWPTQRQKCERPRRQPRSRDRADGTSAGKTHVSRVVEGSSESVESKDIQDPAIEQKVLAHMQAAERGFRRLDAALERVGPEALTEILRSQKLWSIDRVDNLQTLREIVLALEAVAQRTVMKQ